MSDPCPECSREFDSKHSLGLHMRHQHDGRPWIPKDDLERLYFEKDKSQREVADHFDTSQIVVQKAMEKYGLDAEKSRNDPTRPPNHKFDKIGENVGDKYEVIQCTIDYEPTMVYVHRLVAIAHGELSPSEMWGSELVVHHKSEHGLDNRPDNLEVMGRGEHQTHHLEKRYG